MLTAPGPGQIWVAGGTYKPHASDRTVSFVLKTGLAVYGGFTGTESLLSERDIAANPTILSGDLNGDDNENIVSNEPTRSDNSIHVVYGNSVDATALLDGFIIKGGNANAGTFTGGDCFNQDVAGKNLNAASSNNLIEDTGVNACDLNNGVNGNIIGLDPQLGPLSDNGGATQTHALLAGSPAIDKGDNATCAATDQRGVIRPQGTNCDIGAYEIEVEVDFTIFLPIIIKP